MMAKKCLFVIFSFFLFFELAGCQKSEHTKKTKAHLSGPDTEEIKPTQVDTQTFNTMPRYPEGPTKRKSQQRAYDLEPIKSDQIVEQSVNATPRYSQGLTKRRLQERAHDSEPAHLRGLDTEEIKPTQVDTQTFDTKTRYAQSGPERIQAMDSVGDTNNKRMISARSCRRKHWARYLCFGLKNNGVNLNVVHGKKKEIELVSLGRAKVNTKTGYSQSGSQGIQAIDSVGDTNNKGMISAVSCRLKRGVRRLSLVLKNNVANLKVAYCKEKEIELVPLGRARVNTKTGYSQGQSELTQIGIPYAASTDDVKEKRDRAMLFHLQHLLIKYPSIFKSQSADRIYEKLSSFIDYLYSQFDQNSSSVQIILDVIDLMVKRCSPEQLRFQDQYGYTLLHKIFYLTSANNIQLARQLMPKFVLENDDAQFLDKCLSDLVDDLSWFDKDKSSAQTIVDVIEQMIDKRSHSVEQSERSKLQSPSGYTSLHAILALILEEDIKLARRLVPMFVLANNDAKFRYDSLYYLIDYLYSRFDQGGSDVWTILDIIDQIVARCSVEQLNFQSSDEDTLLRKIYHLTLDDNIQLARRLFPTLIQYGAKLDIKESECKRQLEEENLSIESEEEEAADSVSQQEEAVNDSLERIDSSVWNNHDNDE